VLAGLDVAGCLTALGLDSSGRAPDSPTYDFVSLTRSCLLNESVLDRVGLGGLRLAGAVLGAIAGAIGGTIAFLWGSSSALIDQIAGDSNTTIRIGGGSETDSPVSGGGPLGAPPNTNEASGGRSLDTFVLNTSQTECYNGGPFADYTWSNLYRPPVAGQRVGYALWVTPDWKNEKPACTDISLGGQFRTAQGFVGVGDKFPTDSQIRLTFLGDGRELASVTPQLGQRLPLTLDVTGVAVLRIVATLDARSTRSSLNTTAIAMRVLP
jgi:hypothetical protein